MRNFVVIGAAALCAAGGLALAATASILMLLPGERVQGNLSSEGERKTIAFAGVEGTVLDISAAALKGSRVTPTLSLLAPDGTSIDLGATNPASKGRAKAKHVTLGATGIWRIGVETKPGAGGAFELSTKAKVPLKFSWTGTQVDAAAVFDHVLPAAPGGTVSVSVTTKGKVRFDPVVDLISPSGGVVTTAIGAKGRASIAVARLDEFGRYTVRVKGGPGEFSVRAAVKPAGKRSPTYHDVESPPEVLGFSPTTTPNDAIARFELNGFAFSTQQTVSLTPTVAGLAASPIRQVTGTGALADVDLSDVVPGTYELRVATPEGHSVTAPGQLTVTNRTPGVLSISPTEAPNRAGFPLDLRGAGFDKTATVSLRRASDSLTIPLAIQSRSGHDTIHATVTPPAWVTGPCDLEIRDPDGEHVIVPGGIDLLGFRSAPVALLQYNAPDAAQTFNPRDSAYDAAHDRVLVAVQEKNNVAFLLFDPATMTTTDSMVLTAANLGVSGSVVRPRVAWDAVTGTFALGLTAGQSNLAYAVVRVVSDTNIHDTKLQKTLADGAKGVSQITPAANRDDGGYVVSWAQYEGTATGTKLKSAQVTAALTIDTAATHVLASHPLGYLWEPVVAYQGSGRFVVAWIGAAPGDVDYAVYATVVDAAGAQTIDAGPYVSATSSNWNYLFQPEITANRDDGSMLLAFTYLDVNLYRPGVQKLEPVSAQPGPYSSLDSNSALPQGYIDSVRWNPARHEFVATMTTVENRVAVRRVNPDGTLRGAAVPESYEGVWGILWAGPQAGQLGLSRGFDGTADDTHYAGSQVMQVLAGPLR